MAKSYDPSNDKIVSLFRKRKLLASLIVLFLLLVATVSIVTLYGLHTGGFTMSISDDLSNAGVELYQYKEDMDAGINGTAELNGTELSNVQPMAQPQIIPNYVLNSSEDVKGVEKHGGTYQPKNGEKVGDFIGYTFYVKNSGSDSCDMQSQLKITNVSRHMDEAVRIWVFTTRSTGTEDKSGVVYQKPDAYNDKNEPVQVKDYTKIPTAWGNYKETVYFESKSTVVTTPYLDVKPSEYIKVSIVMWIEGEDPQCDDNLFGTGSSGNIEGGSIKISMAFSSYKDKIV